MVYFISKSIVKIHYINRTRIKVIMRSISLISTFTLLILSCSKNSSSSENSDISTPLFCGIDTTFVLSLPAVDISRYSDCRYLVAGIKIWVMHWH